MGKLIGNRIKEIRLDNKFNQNVFADMLGVDPSYISMLESHKKTPSPMLVKSICSNFMVKEEWLTTGKGNKHIKLSDIRANSEKWLNKLAVLGDKDNSVIKNKHETLPDTIEPAISDKIIHRDELVEKISHFLESDALKVHLADFLGSLLHDVIHKFIQDEIKQKEHLTHLVDKFRKIMINTKPPEGVEERRACSTEIEKLLNNNN